MKQPKKSQNILPAAFCIIHQLLVLAVEMEQNIQFGKSILISKHPLRNQIRGCLSIHSV